MKEVCDQISAQGNFRVVLPDIYRGDGFDMTIPKSGKPFMDFVQKYPVEPCIKDFEVVKKYVKETGSKKISIIGICWGVWLSWHVS